MLDDLYMKKQTSKLKLKNRFNKNYPHLNLKKRKI